MGLISHASPAALRRLIVECRYGGFFAKEKIWHFSTMAAGPSTAHSDLKAELQNPVAWRSDNRKTTVIVLDDDLFVCRALKTQLEILGFDILVFHSAEKFLAGEIPSDHACLLADVYLPGINGAELCRRLVSSGTRLPTILMSGRDDDKTTEMMRAAGPAAILFKPFDQMALVRAVKKAFRKKSKFTALDAPDSSRR